MIDSANRAKNRLNGAIGAIPWNREAIAIPSNKGAASNGRRLSG